MILVKECRLNLLSILKSNLKDYSFKNLLLGLFNNLRHNEVIILAVFVLT